MNASCEYMREIRASLHCWQAPLLCLPNRVTSGSRCCKISLGHLGHHTRLILCTRSSRSFRLHINASKTRCEQVCFAGRHCCSACQTGSQPNLAANHTVVKHSWDHLTKLILCTRCAGSLRFHMNASGKRSEQVCTAGRHRCSACQTASLASQPYLPCHGFYGFVKHSWGITRG